MVVTDPPYFSKLGWVAVDRTNAVLMKFRNCKVVKAHKLMHFHKSECGHTTYNYSQVLMIKMSVMSEMCVCVCTCMHECVE